MWNPWIEDATHFWHFDEDEYRQMICVEAGYVTKPYQLEAGQSVTMGQQLSVDYIV